MELCSVRTRDDLIKFLIETKRSAENEAAEDADWFVLCANARMMFESYGVKDLAHALRGGIPAFDSSKDVDDFLATIFEDADMYLEEGADEEAKNALEDAADTFKSCLVEHFGC